MTARPVDINFPQTWEEFMRMPQLQTAEILYKDVHGYRFVLKLAPGVVLKHGGEFGDEILCMKRVQTAGLPVPNVIYHPGSIDCGPSSNINSRKNVWYFCMEEVPGISLDKVVDQLSDDKLTALASQLKSFLDLLSCVPHHQTIGSVDGGAFRTLLVRDRYQPQQPFHTVAEFNNFLGALYGQCVITPEVFAEHMSNLPTGDSIRFTHGDLVPKNIMVDAEGVRITGIIDWGNSGFYPSYWEYCRMHDANSDKVGWAKILSKVFTEPKRQKEIDAVRAILATIDIQF